VLSWDDSVPSHWLRWVLTSFFSRVGLEYPPDLYLPSKPLHPTEEHFNYDKNVMMNQALKKLYMIKLGSAI
jgi:hypothetical protein